MHPDLVAVAVFRIFAGAVYEGLWKDGLKDGLGTHVFASGARYDGMYRKDLMEGDGTYTFEVRMPPPANTSSPRSHAIPAPAK